MPAKSVAFRSNTETRVSYDIMTLDDNGPLKFESLFIESISFCAFPFQIFKFCCSVLLCCLSTFARGWQLKQLAHESRAQAVAKAFGIETRPEEIQTTPPAQANVHQVGNIGIGIGLIGIGIGIGVGLIDIGIRIGIGIP